MKEKEFLQFNPKVHKFMMYTNHTCFFRVISIDKINMENDFDLSEVVVFKNDRLDTHTFYDKNGIFDFPKHFTDDDGSRLELDVEFDSDGYMHAEVAMDPKNPHITTKYILRRIVNLKYIKRHALIQHVQKYSNSLKNRVTYGIITGYIDKKGMWVGHQGDSTIISGGGSPHKIDNGLMEGFPSIFEDGSSVVDFGCGNADYIKRLISDGFKCEAYDGNPITPKMTGGIGKVLDLSKRFDLEKKFDYVISVEVAEHIPKEYEEIYVDNLIRHTGYYLITSWAIKGQGGDGHVNEQDEDYVLNLYKEKGMVYQKDISEALRGVATLGWFKKTIYVFEKG